MANESLLLQIDPYHQASVVLRKYHTRPSLAGSNLGDLSHAFRQGVWEGVLRTTKFFNKTRKDKIYAHTVMAEVFGDDGWAVGMTVDDGTPRPNFGK